MHRANPGASQLREIRESARQLNCHKPKALPDLTVLLSQGFLPSLHEDFAGQNSMAALHSVMQCT
jgi:hypothetical protein